MTLMEPPALDSGIDLLSPAERLDSLATEAAACRMCARMAERPSVLSRLNGSATAQVLFIAEAPGRLGGDRTRVPLSGDQAGRNFEALLQVAGIRRQEVFITNAVLCNPRDGAGRNAAPSTSEIRNCRGFLERTIQVINPVVVVTLGAVALRALDLIEHHGAVLRDDVATPLRWNGRWLVPLYHPGAPALIHRPFASQCDDYRQLAAHLAACVRT